MHKTLLIIVIAICVSTAAAVFAAEGDLDPSFGQSGVVTFNKGAGSSAAAEALQPDGKKIIAGTVPGSSNSDILVLRLNPDGTRDTSFGVSGAVIFSGIPDAPDSAAGVALQADGRIVVVGQRFNGKDSDILVFRLRADGTLDASFRGTGSAQYDLGGNESAAGVALQADGRIVLAGAASNASDNDLVIMRLTSDGQRDLSFSTNGIFTYDGGGDDAGNAVAIQTNGGIVVAGQSSNGANPDIIVVRLTVSGLLDNTLNGTGILLLDRGGRDIGKAVAIQSNGKILVAGLSSNGVDADLLVVRLNQDGVPDTTFNGNGIFVFDGGAGADSGNGVAVQTNGDIVVTGSSSNGVNEDVIVMRLTPNGIRDVTFSGNGIARYHASALGDAAGNAVRVQPDGRILVAGFGAGGLNSYVLVLRYDANGDLDTTFNGTGVVTFRKKVNTADAGNAVAVQSDGSIVVIGQTAYGADNDILTLRFKSDGTLDTSFNENGVAVFAGAAGGDDIGRAVALQDNGKIVVAGQTSGGGNSDVLVLRYATDGALDTTFSGNGAAVYNGAANGDDIGRAAAIQSDGKIVVVGQTFNGTTNNLLVLRYAGDGSLDASFGTGGVATFGGSAATTGRAVAIQPDGRIIAAGVTSNGTDSDILLVRFDANGSPDATFGAGGAVIYNSGNDDAARAVTLQTDGKIVVAGFRNNGTKNIALVMRFTASGSLDNTFGGDGVVKYNSGTAGDDIGNAVAVQADDRIVAAGTTNGSDVLLLRYLADGTPDPGGAFSDQGAVTFSRGAAGDAGNALILQSDGKIVVAGISDNDILVLRFIGQKLKLVAPNGGERLAASSLYNIEWTSPPNAVSFTLQLSLDSGATWGTIASGVAAGPYAWTVPTPFGTKTQCLVRVKSFDVDNAKAGSDQSNAVFTIEPVTLTTPNGGELFTSGETVAITWTTHATKQPVAAVKLSYTLNGGTTWNTIDTSADPSDDGNFSWTAPAVTAVKKARVKIVLKDSTGRTLGSDASDAVFKISPP